MEFKAAQIAALAGGSVDGDPDVAVSAVSKIEEGRPGSISFLANPKYTHYIYDTEASIVLVSRDFVPERPVKPTLIRVDDPYATVTRLLSIVAEMMAPKPVGIEQPSYVSEGVELPEDVYVGAFAYVGRGVKLGKGVKIYPQVYIGDGVTVGDDTVLYPGVKIYYGCSIGARCIIHAGAVIGADGFGFAPNPDGSYTKIPQTGIVEISDDVEIGANTAVDRSTMGATRVARGAKIDNLVQVGHNCEVGADTVISAQCGLAGSTHLGERCMVAGQVGFAGHISIADGVRIGAQSGVPNNIRKPGSYMGYPAVEARQFLRQSALIKNLPEMFEQLRQIKSTLEN